jgi:2-polyprenyl-3-methyl-5-hydroxy-6-metoxy-1,4-benzoquinol methylase
MVTQRISSAIRRRLRPATLENGGERVDIDLARGTPEWSALDQYQRSHLRRYEFAAGQVGAGWDVGDFACGAGYGSVMLAQRSASVLGVDVDPKTVATVKKRYRGLSGTTFVVGDLVELALDAELDAVVSFETLEHLEESALVEVLRNFRRALRPRGTLIASTPYRQEASQAALDMGFHRTFEIDEQRLRKWLREVGFGEPRFWYQSYAHHDVAQSLDAPDFVIVVAEAAP